MLKIYANAFSMPCNKVRYAAELVGVEYEWIHKEFDQKELKSPEFLAIHPAGKLPAIDDDGFILFESDAICRYLAAKADSPIYPSELKARALCDQWTAFGNFHVGLAMAKVLYNRMIAPKFGLFVDENSMREGVEWLARYLPIVDTQLGKNPFLAGSDLTLADVTVLSILDRSSEAEIDLAPYQNLIRWIGALHEREFWKKCSEA